MKYSDLMCKWLVEAGYTHCFFLAGGNNMHLLESASHHFQCVATVHEVAAGIAAEYFNETETGKKAFVLVTAGPGLTNLLTAIGGAYLESRELLVIGGQVKTSDLSHGQLRQRGIQEIDGVDLARPITKASVLLNDVIDKKTFTGYLTLAATPRKGPVFIEMPLDIQGRQVEPELLEANYTQIAPAAIPAPEKSIIAKIAAQTKQAQRPVILLGAGVSRAIVSELRTLLDNHTIPVMTTWNAMDRLDAAHPLYMGRPNTWGQRYANILLQQADLLIAVGSRLGMQQTGFNWKKFIPVGKIVQVDCDEKELSKGHPKIDVPVCADANQFILELLKSDLGNHSEWLSYCQEAKSVLPLEETCNTTSANHLSPYRFCSLLSDVCAPNDVIIPCSSGGAFTTMMQIFAQKKGQTVITNKALASMGYGLSGAIGAAYALQPHKVILVEGDGGFAQNLQEIGTAAVNNLNLKIFIYDNHGYASIRMTQRGYFKENYIGCDIETGLGMPDWKLFAAYHVPCLRLSENFTEDAAFQKLFNSNGVAAFIVPVDTEQTYFPKITSKVLADGSMESNPLHLMTPELPADVMAQVGKYFS